MTEAQARKLCEQAGAPLPPGMHAGNFEKVKNSRRKVIDGIEFRSTLEADVYVLLKSWARAGAIRNLVCQPKYLLQPKMRLEGKTQREITYVADFQFERRRPIHMERSGCPEYETIVIDAKGYRMEIYRLKVKLFRAKFPDIVFQEWTRETLKANGG